MVEAVVTIWTVMWRGGMTASKGSCSYIGQAQAEGADLLSFILG